MTVATLPQIGRRVPVAAGQTLLEAALAAGVSYPHSCRSGRCAACKSRLVEGSVTLGSHTPFSLTEAEKADGLILACRAVPESDVTVAWLAGADAVPDRAVVRQQATVVDLAGLTHDIRGIRLRLEDRAEFDFRPGQYVRFTMDGAPPRDYSIASRPDEELVELHVRAVPGGRTSSRVMFGLRLGDAVTVEGPYGSAFLREAHAGPIVAIAGGSGLAPIKSIVESALARDPDRRVAVYFGGRAARDVYMVERFADLQEAHPNLRFLPVLSHEPAAGWRSGFVSDAVAEDFDDLSGFKAYVAGPPAMVDAASAVLSARGLQPGDIHADVFFTPEEKDAKVHEEVTS